MMTSRFSGTRAKAVGGSALLALIAIGVALATTLASGSTVIRHPRRSITHGRLPLTAGVAAKSLRNRSKLAHQFTALRPGLARAGSAATALPQRLSEEVTSIAHSDTPQGRIAPNPALAVYVGSIDVEALGSEMRLWLIPGANGVCLAESAGDTNGTTCASDAEAAAGGLTGTLQTKSGLTTYGVIPGSATMATVSQQGGGQRTVPVENGLWVLNGDPQAVSLSISGVRAVALP
jgi:hypothetical protein